MRETRTTVERKMMIEIPQKDIQEWKDEICEILMDLENVPDCVVFTNNTLRITFESEVEYE